MKLFTQYSRKLTKVTEILKITRQAKSVYGLRFIDGLYRLRWLRKKHEYPPTQAFRLGLLNPQLKRVQFNRFISLPHLMQVQSNVSPPELNSLVCNKALFHLYGSERGLPVPKSLGIFWRQAPGIDEGGKLLSQRTDWINYIQRRFHGEFITKSSGAHYGSSIRIYKRIGDEFINLSSNKVYDANELYREFEVQAGEQSIVIQERVYNHSSIVEFTQNNTLQTIRVVSYIDRSSKLKILHAIMRPVATNELIDNYNNFDGGILLARVDVETGKIMHTHFMRDDIPGTSIIENHPITNKPFSGFQIPDWESAMNCIRNAAFKMLPMRLVGWDLAITPTGPIIVEGNASFNTNYLYKNSKDILFADMQAAGHSLPHTMDPPPWIKE
jgi:hypothetical protein